MKPQTLYIRIHFVTCIDRTNQGKDRAMTPSTQVLEVHIDVNSPNINVVDLIQGKVDLSKQKIKTAMQKGCVWVTAGKNTRRLRRSKTQLKPGQKIHVYYNESVLAVVPPVPELIADESHFSVWNKPCGLFSQGSKWGDHCTLVRWSEQNLRPQRNAFLVHRLDRATSGLMILAHSKEAARKMSHLFASRSLTKQYAARVEGRWPHLEHHTVSSAIDGKPAVSHIQMKGYRADDDTSLLHITIETGRKHQIRKHLSQHGFPVLGDRLYGSNNHSVDLQLTSIRLKFQCPFSHTEKHYQIEEQFI